MEIEKKFDNERKKFILLAFKYETLLSILIQRVHTYEVSVVTTTLTHMTIYRRSITSYGHLLSLISIATFVNMKKKIYIYLLFNAHQVIKYTHFLLD